MLYGFLISIFFIAVAKYEYHTTQISFIVPFLHFFFQIGSRPLGWPPSNCSRRPFSSNSTGEFLVLSMVLFFSLSFFSSPVFYSAPFKSPSFLVFALIDPLIYDLHSFFLSIKSSEVYVHFRFSLIYLNYFFNPFLFIIMNASELGCCTNGSSQGLPSRHFYSSGNNKLLYLSVDWFDWFH